MTIVLTMMSTPAGARIPPGACVCLCSGRRNRCPSTCHVALTSKVLDGVDASYNAHLERVDLPHLREAPAVCTARRTQRGRRSATCPMAHAARCRSCEAHALTAFQEAVVVEHRHAVGEHQARLRKREAHARRSICTACPCLLSCTGAPRFSMLVTCTSVQSVMAAAPPPRVAAHAARPTWGRVLSSRVPLSPGPPLCHSRSIWEAPLLRLLLLLLLLLALLARSPLRPHPGGQGDAEQRRASRRDVAIVPPAPPTGGPAAGVVRLCVRDRWPGLRRSSSGLRRKGAQPVVLPRLRLPRLHSPAHAGRPGVAVLLARHLGQHQHERGLRRSSAPRLPGEASRSLRSASLEGGGRLATKASER